MADVGTAGGSSDAGSSSPNEEIQALKRLLQDQRRRTTLLNADLQRQIEAREAVQAQLIEAHAELAASRDRRKEMARVITDREAKVAALNDEIRSRYEELAALERHILHSTWSWKTRELFRRTKRLMRRAFRQKAHS